MVRINNAQPTQQVDNQDAAVKPQPQVAAQSGNETDKASKINLMTIASQALRFRAEQALLNNNAATPAEAAPAAAKTPQLKAGEAEQIEKGTETVFQKMGSGEGKATVELAKQLRGKSADYQAAFMANLNDKIGPFNMESLLATAGGRTPHYISDARPSADDTRVISQALGNAFDKGAISRDAIAQLLETESNRLHPENDYLGNLVAASGSKQLKQTFFDESMKLYDANNYQTANFNSGAAKALASDPQLLQSKLAELNKKGELQGFIENLDPKKFNVPYYEEANNALAAVVSGAARIQPPTPEVAQLFRTAADNYMDGEYSDRYGMADAMTKLFTGGYSENIRAGNGRIVESQFHSNAEFLMLELSKNGKANGQTFDPTAITSLNKFFANTVFNDEFENSELVKTVAQREIKNLQQSIENYPNVNSRTKSLIDASINIPKDSNENAAYQVKEQMTFRLGKIVGSVFRGFEEAVKTRNDSNAAKDKAVDLVFDMLPIDKAKDAVVAFVPGGGKAAGWAADKAVEFGKDQLKNWLHDKDLNDDRAEIHQMIMKIAGSVTTDLYDEFSGGYGEVAQIAADTQNK